MNSYSEKLYGFLSSFISDERKKKFESIVQSRTRYLTVALEDIYQPHNASAVLRSAEGFGVQDIHIIENKNRYSPNPDVALGANKWLTLHKYTKEENNTLACIRSLREKKFRIVATSPHKNDCNIDELDVTKGKIALFFGTELEGASKTLLGEADEFVKIPMSGFTESFNISVSAAVCMYELTRKIRNSNVQWKLPEEEMLEIKLEWAKNSVSHPDLLEAEFRKQNGI